MSNIVKRSGRPSSYTDDIADEICERLSSGESLLSITGDDDMPAQSSVYRWLNQYPDFQEKYAKARVAQAHAIAERAAEMASGKFEITDPSFARLQLDAIKWMAGKLAPKSYGDKVDLNVGGQEGGAPVATVLRWEK
jgi:hypothetical protein